MPPVHVPYIFPPQSGFISRFAHGPFRVWAADGKRFFAQTARPRGPFLTLYHAGGRMASGGKGKPRAPALGRVPGMRRNGSAASGTGLQILAAGHMLRAFGAGQSGERSPLWPSGAVQDQMRPGRNAPFLHFAKGLRALFENRENNGLLTNYSKKKTASQPDG